jgi:Transposase domain (DUF772)
LNRVRSSRRLELESHRNIEVIWLLRSLKPDFKTVADFRPDNRAAFRAVFRQFTLLCRELNLFGRKLLAVDGTRIKTVNNEDRNFTKNSLEKFIKHGSRTKNLAEKIAALREKRGRYGALLTELERSGESQISLTDPDSRAKSARPFPRWPGTLRMHGFTEDSAGRRPYASRGGGAVQCLTLLICMARPAYRSSAAQISVARSHNHHLSRGRTADDVARFQGEHLRSLPTLGRLPWPWDPSGDEWIIAFAPLAKCLLAKNINE